jgi:multiple sugar transport system permease protein
MATGNIPTASTAGVSIAPARRPRRRLPRRAGWAYLFLTPALLGMTIFAVGPILFTGWVSFHEWNMLTPVGAMNSVGLGNYRYLLTEDHIFLMALKNTFIFAIAGVTVNTVLGLATALLLNTQLRLRTLWRTLYFLPVVTAPLALAVIWGALYNRNYGMINSLLIQLGLPPQPFLSSPDQALGAIIAIAVYQYVGYYTVIFLAGLQGIPEEYYDAAKVDGANSWQSFWKITLPLLRPVMLFVVVTNTIGALQVFDIVFATTGGGPANSTNVVVLHMYDTAFKFWRMGRATAMAFILFAVVMAITLIQLRLLRQKT